LPARTASGNIPATIPQNHTESTGFGSSKYKGVTWYSREKRWVAKITADGITTPLGYFKNEIQAAQAYDQAARKYHAEFAALNFPTTPNYPPPSQ